MHQTSWFIHSWKSQGASFACKNFRKTYKLDCGANYVLLNAPKMLGALRTPSYGIAKDIGTTAKGSWWRIQVDSHPSHHQQCAKDHHISTSTLEELDTIFAKVSEARSTNGIRRECNAGRPIRSLESGICSPQISDMTAGDEERATDLVNFMTKNGLVAQHTWTAAAAPREEMCTRREWGQTRDIGQLRGWNKGGLCFDVRDSAKRNVAESNRTRSRAQTTEQFS